MDSVINIPTRDSGNCKKLIGKIKTINYFLDDAVSSWTKENYLDFYNKIYYPAINFITSAAKKYGVTLSICGENFSFRDSLKYTDVINDLNDLAVTQLTKRLNYPSVIEKIKRIQGNCDALASVYIFNKLGKNNEYIADNTVIPEEEHAILFTKRLDSGIINAADYARSLLRLFGAIDLSYPSDIINLRQIMAAKRFPKDVMLWSSNDINKLSVGKLTAYCIGWTDTIPSTFNPFLYELPT